MEGGLTEHTCRTLFFGAMPIRPCIAPGFPTFPAPATRFREKAANNPPFSHTFPSEKNRQVWPSYSGRSPAGSGYELWDAGKSPFSGIASPTVEGLGIATPGRRALCWGVPEGVLAGCLPEFCFVGHANLLWIFRSCIPGHKKDNPEHEKGIVKVRGKWQIRKERSGSATG